MPALTLAYSRPNYRKENPQVPHVDWGKEDVSDETRNNKESKASLRFNSTQSGDQKLPYGRAQRQETYSGVTIFGHEQPKELDCRPSL